MPTAPSPLVSPKAPSCTSGLSSTFLSRVNVLTFNHFMHSANSDAAHAATSAKMSVLDTADAYAARSCRRTSGFAAQAPRPDAPALATASEDTAVVWRGISRTKSSRNNVWAMERDSQTVQAQTSTNWADDNTVSSWV